MYSTINKDEIYYVYDGSNNTRKRIGTRKDLYHFIAIDLLKLNHPFYGYNFMRRISELEFHHLTHYDIGTDVRHTIFQSQNISGNDYEHRQSIHQYADMSYYDYDNYVLKRYTFYTGTGRIVDIRSFYEDVKVYMLTYTRPYTKRRQYSYQKSHTQYSHSPKHTYISDLRKDMEFKRHIQKKDREKYDWTYPTRHSSGWKAHKYKKQYMHNLDNKKIKSNSAKLYWQMEYKNVYADDDDDDDDDMMDEAC